MKRRYYGTKRRALNHREEGDRIYYDAYEGSYYLVNYKKKSFWKEINCWQFWMGVNFGIVLDWLIFELVIRM